MGLEKEDDIVIEEKEEKDNLSGDPLDLMTKAVEVHTKGINLNEDATLSNLDAQLSKYAKYVMEQLAVIGVVRGFLKTDCNIIRYGNDINNWGKEIKYENPENIYFDKCSTLLMNKVHSMLILTRAVKGKPLRAFLEYGQGQKEQEKEKQGWVARLLGKKEKTEDEEEMS